MNTQNATIPAKLKLKKIVWDEGMDWATGKVNGRNIVRITMNDHMAQIRFGHEFVKLSADVTCNSVPKTEDFDLQQLKKTAETNYSNYIYTIYFDLIPHD